MVQPSSPLQPRCELGEASSIHNTCRWGPILQGWWIHGMVLCQCFWPARNGTWCFDLQIPHRNYPRKMDAESFRPLDESQNNVSFFTPTQEKVRSNCSIWYFVWCGNILVNYIDVGWISESLIPPSHIWRLDPTSTRSSPSWPPGLSRWHLWALGLQWASMGKCLPRVHLVTSWLARLLRMDGSTWPHI